MGGLLSGPQVFMSLLNVKLNHRIVGGILSVEKNHSYKWLLCLCTTVVLDVLRIVFLL